MPENGKYIEIAGGTITERYQDNYEMFAGGNINLGAAKSFNQTGAGNGVTFNAPKQPKQQQDDTQEQQEHTEDDDMFIYP